MFQQNSELFDKFIDKFIEQIADRVAERIDRRLEEILNARPKKERYTVQEVAEILGVSAKTIHRHCIAGELSFGTVGRKKWITQQGLDEFLERKTTRAIGAPRRKLRVVK